jgi:hypothetical protein
LIDPGRYSQAAPNICQMINSATINSAAIGGQNRLSWLNDAADAA